MATPYFPSLTFFLFLFSVSFSSPSPLSPTDQISSCLDVHNVNNYSVSPVSGNNGRQSTAYFNLLNFSIQNLRFLEPTILKPMVIILPETVDQLMNSVLCCRTEPWEIRVRCGGHSYEGTSSVTGNGAPFVIIDMMNLNRVTVDMETETAWVEGGATLGETYYAISEASGVHGFSAGSCPTVGVGGHIGGGGFGFLSRKYGLAADNVIDALLINSEGKLLNRDAMGEDVFWAIRGGGGGIWGIIYAWKIRLLKVPETVTTFTVSRAGPKHHVALLVNKWQLVSPQLDGDFYLSCFLGARKTTGIISATFNGFFLGPRSQAVSILTLVFPELGVSGVDCREMTWIESIVYFSGLSSGSTASDLKNRYLKNKRYFKAKADYVREPISLLGMDTAMNILEKEPKGYMIMDPYGGVMNNISSESIAFPHRKGSLFSIQYLVDWHEKENGKSQEYIEWIRELYDAMTPYVSMGPRAAYINYMDFDLGVEQFNRSVQDEDPVEKARVWGEKYFLKNFERLVRAKTVIDPTNVFNNQQGIPPRISLHWLSNKQRVNYKR